MTRLGLSNEERATQRPFRGRLRPVAPPQPPQRTGAERAKMAVEAAYMARDNARQRRALGDPDGARKAFWRAYDYLDMAREWRGLA